MGLLHPTRYVELAAEFVAGELIERAIGALTPDDDPATEYREDLAPPTGATDGAARALYHLDWARRCLHEQVRNPEARKEFEARVAGTWVDPAPEGRGPGTRRAPQASAEMDALKRQVAELSAALAKLTGASSQGAADAEPASGEGGERGKGPTG